MEIKIPRKWFYKDASLGVMQIDFTYACFTLEDAARPAGIKVDGHTCIPPGRYRVMVDWSRRFISMMPHVLDVPGFDGIRIHSGNTEQDTSGCILVGFERDRNTIYKSRDAFNYVFDKIKQAIAKGEEVWLEVENQP